MRRLTLLMAFSIVLLTVAVASVYPEENKLTPEQRHAKARYYYLEAAESNACDDFLSAFLLMEKAYRTDPDYLEAAYGYGNYLMSIVSQDTTEKGLKKWEEGAMLRQSLIDAYPSDQAQVRLYAQQIMADPRRTINGRPVGYEAIRVLERLDSIGSSNSNHLLQLSGIYSVMEMPDSVLGVLSRYERREGSSPELLENKVALLFRSGSIEKASDEIEKYRVGHPRDEYPFILKAMLKYAQEDSDSSLYYLKEAEKLNPSNFEVKVRIGMMGLEMGDTLLYSSKIMEALELPEGEFEEKMDLMRSYYSEINFAGDEEQARKIREIFTSLHGQFPQDSELYYLEGLAEASMDNMDKGIELIRRSISLNPEDIKTRKALIQVLLRNGKEEEALEELRKIWVELEPDQSIRSVSVALALKNDNPDLALSFLREAAKNINSKIDIDEPFTLENEILPNLGYNDYVNLGYIFEELGDVYHRMGKFDEMVRSFESSLQLLPNEPLILNNYAYYLALEGKSLDQAEQMAGKAVTLSPGNPTYIDTQAWVLYRLGRFEEAEKVIKEGIDIYESELTDEENDQTKIEAEMTEILNHYGEILFALGRKDEARAQWERVLKIDPDNESAKNALAK